MKTSNKILLGLLVVIFTVPLLLAATLKNKVKKGEYTVEKYKKEINQHLSSGSFAAFKVVKVVAPGPSKLEVKLHASNEMNYKYYRHNEKDSVKIETVNDTLMVQFVGTYNEQQENEGEWYNRLSVNINLPAFNNLVVDGAVVIIDSFPAESSNLSVVIKNRGELKDGSKKMIKGEKIFGKNNIGSEIKEKELQVKSTEKPGYEMGIRNFEAVKVLAVEEMQMNIKEQMLSILIKGI